MNRQQQQQPLEKPPAGPQRVVIVEPLRQYGLGPTLLSFYLFSLVILQFLLVSLGVKPSVVNGGLIDFQDNFHRGLAEYANYMAVQQQQQQSLMGGGMYSPSGAQPASLAGYPTHLQQVQQQASLMTFQQQQQQQQAGMATTVQSNQLPCISGPPAYVHINGQTYVPVDSPQVGKPATAQQPQAVVAVEPEPASLSNEDIDRRVYAQVEAWASRQRKPYQAAAPAAAESAGDGGRKHLKGRAAVSDEDRAAERVNSVNAGMRGGTARFYSPM